MTEITNKIYYVGVNDRNKHRFEGLWPLPNGVSYNSYIIDDEVIDFAVANHLVNVLEELGEEIYLYSIYQRYLLIVNDIRVVAHSVRQRPEALKTMLVAVVYAYVINLVCNFCHIIYFEL